MVVLLHLDLVTVDAAGGVGLGGPHVEPSMKSLIGSAKGPDFPKTTPTVIVSAVTPGAAAPDAAVVAAPAAAAAVVAAPPVVAALVADVAVVPVVPAALVAELDELLSLPHDAISNPATAGNASHPSRILPFAILPPLSVPS